MKMLLDLRFILTALMKAISMVKSTSFDFDSVKNASITNSNTPFA